MSINRRASANMFIASAEKTRFTFIHIDSSQSQYRDTLVFTKLSPFLSVPRAFNLHKYFLMLSLHTTIFPGLV